MSIFSFFRSRKKRDLDNVSFTDEAVIHTRDDATQETIRWDELDEVGIVTTDEGPFQEDVFFVLLREDGKSGCVIPQLSKDSKMLLERLQKLPGFDNEAFIKAMGSTSNGKFLCWKRKLLNGGLSDSASDEPHPASHG